MCADGSHAFSFEIKVNDACFEFLFFFPYVMLQSFSKSAILFSCAVVDEKQMTQYPKVYLKHFLHKIKNDFTVR